MSAEVVDGVALGARLRADVAARAEAVRKKRGRAPRLAIVAAGSDRASQSYRQTKLKACRETGLEAEASVLAPEKLLAGVESLGKDASVDAIIVELPLPGGLSAEEALSRVPPSKDVEGLCPENYGRLFLAKTYAAASRLVAPCTALAAVEILRETKVPVAGKRAVVIGRSNILGRPAAHFLTTMDATVTLCHSRSAGLESEVRRADIVLACAGRAGLVKGEWIKPGAVVVDAGVNPKGKGFCGDVEFDAACRNAAFITPVPGGVGPVTTAMLLSGVVRLAERRP